MNRSLTFSFWLALSLCLYALNLSCGSKPTDMRALVPAETLVYLETNDLAGALQPIVASKPFAEVATSKPDLSALKGVQLAVAVTGFETTEEKLNNDESVANVRPRFVAVAETHAWNYQAVRFAEVKLGDLVEDIYRAEPKLERSDAKGGKFFVWTATDGRKAYALVIDSLIWFGNDETAIDKCLAVRRGEADPIAAAGKVQPAASATLARGYISTDGIAQIAALIGVKFASVASDDAELRTAVATVLPDEIRNSVTDIAWTMAISERGIEDRYVVNMPPNRRSTEFLSEIGTSLSDSIIETSGDDLADAFGTSKSGAAGANIVHMQENRPTTGGIERRTVSDLGFLGWVIAQLASA